MQRDKLVLEWTRKQRHLVLGKWQVYGQVAQACDTMLRHLLLQRGALLYLRMARVAILTACQGKVSAPPGLACCDAA
jgi:hypothetical protein